MDQTHWLDEEAITPRQAQRVREISRRLSSETNTMLHTRSSNCLYVETVTPAKTPSSYSSNDNDNEPMLVADDLMEDSEFEQDDAMKAHRFARMSRIQRSASEGLSRFAIPAPPKTVPLWRWLKKKVPYSGQDEDSSNISTAATLRQDSRHSLPSFDSKDMAMLETRRRTLENSTRTSESANNAVEAKLSPVASIGKIRSTMEEKAVGLFFASDSPMVPGEDSIVSPTELPTEPTNTNSNFSNSNFSASGMKKNSERDRKESKPLRPPVFTEVGDSAMVGMAMYRKQESMNEKMSHGRHAATEMRVPDEVKDAPRLAMEETQKYTMAIILRHTEEVFRILRRRFPSKSAASIQRDLDQQVAQLQQKAVRRLIQSGLGVLVLDNDIYENDHDDTTEEQAAMNICILVDPKKDPTLLVHEFKREMDELAIHQGEANGHMAEESIDSIKQMCFSPALELQLTHNIIQNAFRDYDKEEWVVDVNRELTSKDIIKDCFPLHDRQFNKKFFAAYRKNTFSFDFRKILTGNRDRWAIEELRLHFGERVAFLFAFMHLYTKYLTPLMIFCVLYYLAFRFIPSYIWRQYIEGLALIGFFVACIWAPSFLVFWERETRVLLEKWNLTKYKNTVYEKNDYNPEFEYIWVKNELTHEMEKVPAPRKNHMIQTTMFLYVVLSAILQCICVVPFIQWYVYAKNAPTCDECRTNTYSSEIYSCAWFVTCFNSSSSALGTDRWFYILLQGVVLGLLIDIIFFEVFNWVSEKFVKWENYAKLSDYEGRLVHRRFVFVWSNWFFWFLFIAFVYLPFGNTFLNLFRRAGLGKLAPYQFEAGKLTLDTLFVTPLVVTQFLNMLLETFVPYLLRKLRGRPITWRKSSIFRWCGQRLCRCFYKPEQSAAGQSTENTPGRFLTAKRLARLLQQRSGLNVDVKAYAEDSNAYCAYEIVAESKLPVFDPVSDYLDACIQFSYVVMFTVVWPLLPAPAVLNNIFEVRGDAFRLLFAHRRPMPRRDTSIGEWATVLAYANIFGIIVCVGFLAMYHYGYFVTSACNFFFNDGVVVPFSMLDATTASNPIECANEHTTNSSNALAIMAQVIVFLVLEHVGFLSRYLVLQVEKVPSTIRSSGYQRLKQIQRLTNGRAAPASQFEYIQQLKALFDKYDIYHDGHLREPHLIAFIAEWICKHPTELIPYSSIIFRYMDKNGLGKVPFSTCCLMLQHVNHDRFFSCLLGLYDPEHGEFNSDIHNAADGIALHRVMSEVSSFVSHRNSTGSVASLPDNRSSFGRARDSSFFYVN